jgi:hypothetical protein
VTYRPGKGTAHLRERLQQQRRLADARIAAHQHHRAFDQAAAEDAVEFADAGRYSRFLAVPHFAQRRDLGASTLPAQPPRRAAGALLAAGSSVISLSAFHAPQASHCPCHFA